MLRSTLLACSGLLFLSACDSEPAAPDPAAPAVAAASETTPAGDTARKFFGREAFTIVMEQSGREVGTVTMHYRDWGRRSAEVIRVRNEATGRLTDTRSFTDGAVSVTIDNVTGEVSVYENPYYEEPGAETVARAPDAFGASAMAEMGAEKIGESASFAGEPCDYWQVMGTRKCVSPWGPTLHSVLSMDDIAAERTAIEVRVGDGGPDSAFVYVPPPEEAAVAAGQ